MQFQGLLYRALNPIRAVLHHIGGSHGLGPDGARVVACQALGIAAIHHREADALVQPALG